jgi:two-component system phosphate regulon sensor histidine kinase PhoR
MKRIFPIIVLLITLSLLGLILLQVSWFKNMLILRQEQLLSKVEEVGFDVALELSVQASSAPTLKIPRNPRLGGLLSEDFGFGIGRPTISQNYSFFEINEKLQKKFEEKESVVPPVVLPMNQEEKNLLPQDKDARLSSLETGIIF